MEAVLSANAALAATPLVCLLLRVAAPYVSLAEAILQQRRRVAWLEPGRPLKIYILKWMRITRTLRDTDIAS